MAPGYGDVERKVARKGDIAFGVVFLALLRRGGAVRTRKEGRQVHCSLDLESIRRHQLAFWELLTEKRTIGVRV